MYYTIEVIVTSMDRFSGNERDITSTTEAKISWNLGWLLKVAPHPLLTQWLYQNHSILWSFTLHKGHSRLLRRWKVQIMVFRVVTSCCNAASTFRMEHGPPKRW